MDKPIDGTQASFQESVHDVCHAFYRYEIKLGMTYLEPMLSQIALILRERQLSDGNIQEINSLLDLILTAIEKKDFLIAADLLKYELLERIL